MIKISLVGDIGAGKTYVSKLFMAPCFSADTEVAKIYKGNRKCLHPSLFEKEMLHNLF